MNIGNLIVSGVILTGVLLSVHRGKLTRPAAFCGGLLAAILFWGAGFTGIVLLAAFFITGNLATAWKMDIKIKTGVSTQTEAKRDTGQVIANAGVAAILACLIRFVPENTAVLLVMIAGCFSAATADTLSSELGKVYGQNCYHLFKLRKMPCGTNGAISIQGTLCGIAGSVFIALVFILCEGWNLNQFAIIIIAGTFGNLTDTLLGLTFENNGVLGNNSVNFLNTAAGALCAGMLFIL